MAVMSPVVHAVIAVKRLDRAKTRLAGHFGSEDRGRLVLAMLEDTLRAAADAPGVAGLTVVTPDPAVAAVARRRGAAVRPEPANPTADGLNAALAAGAAHIRQTCGPVGLLALQADLPALRSAELAEALASVPARTRAVVTDHQRTGTSALLVNSPDAALDPAFGPDSARRHLAAGAVDLAGDWPGLRLDVDTAADLRQALRLGVGESTREFLASIGWACPATMCSSLAG
jgi:2-phospho-L-lactate guanylyltransferase